MATLSNKALFFTTSPRSPGKMIPEIRLLGERFSGRKWEKQTQIDFIDALAKSDFFEGTGSKGDKAFSARDRINRAPKALGFVKLAPEIELTEAGKELVYGKRPQEVFLRQILKFQLPSPYHVEGEGVRGTFFVRPYLEILRLIRELEHLTFDEVKIFALQLTDYRRFDEIKNKILDFRREKTEERGSYKKLVQEVWNREAAEIYREAILSGETKTRESRDDSLKKFLNTKKGNLRDYADACFRYLRYTGLVSISHRGRSISFFEEKLPEVDYLLETVDRRPVFTEDTEGFQAHLFDAYSPELYGDRRENVEASILRLSPERNPKEWLAELNFRSTEQLKDLRDEIIGNRREEALRTQVEELKSHRLYQEILDTYGEIVSGDLYDAPLMMEWNTWRAVTMLAEGAVRGNFKVDDEGAPLSTAQGNMADIECDYETFALSVEVTLQSGQRQYETEGEPVARHYGQLKMKTGKETYCLFVAPTVNPAARAHFYMLNKVEISYYGGRAKIVPLELSQWVRMLKRSELYAGEMGPDKLRQFFDSAAAFALEAKNEVDWAGRIDAYLDRWPAA